MTQPAFPWDADVNLPISGRTPLARHCSATGAQAAALRHGSKLARLLDHFSQHRRLTLHECAALMGIQDHALCSTWNRAKYALTWIEETGETKANGRARQAYHRITEAGKQVAFDRVKFTVERIEARS